MVCESFWKPHADRIHVAAVWHVVQPGWINRLVTDSRSGLKVVRDCEQERVEVMVGSSGAPVCIKKTPVISITGVSG
jgi:hypothetical protein